MAYPDRTPVDDLVEARQPRQGTVLSPAIKDVILRRDAVAKWVRGLQAEHEAACEAVAKLDTDYKEANARAYLEAEGPVKEREARATLATIKLYGQWQAQLGVRRSAEKAMELASDDLELLTAALHAHNREVRELGG